MRDYLNQSAKTHFIFPIDGDCLNDRDGEMTQEGMIVTVQVASAPGGILTVNGISATEENGIYRASVCIPFGRTELLAKNESDGTTAVIRVFFFPHTTEKFRLSVDDNILCLADLTKNKDIYHSIFDNPYLAIYKRLHDHYGAKVPLNVFYEFNREAAVCFSKNRPDFNLSMMTDHFREEWEANADWLKLSFHSRAEMPDKPYELALPETIIADYEAVRREVLRFAGEKSFSSALIRWPACSTSKVWAGYTF